MAKNKGKGGKNRRRGKTGDSLKRELILRDQDQEYGQVTKMLGNARIEVQCFQSNRKIQGHIRGKMRKKVWITVGDIVLVSLRDYQDDKCDVILKYTSDEARSLKKKGELPDSVNINETENVDEEMMEFDDDEDEGEDEIDSASEPEEKVDDDFIDNI